MNEHKGYRFVGKVAGIDCELHLNNSRELPKVGATGLVESQEPWAVKARKDGVLDAILKAELKARNGHGAVLDDSEGYVVVGDTKPNTNAQAGHLWLGTSWLSKELRVAKGESAGRGTRYNDILDKVQKALDDNPNNKKLRELFADEIKELEERKVRAEQKSKDAIATLLASGLSAEQIVALAKSQDK